MKKLKMFFGASALAIALIGSVATKATTKITPYYYYNTLTGTFVLVPLNTNCDVPLPIQCTYANTSYPIYATASFSMPLRRAAI